MMHGLAERITGCVLSVDDELRREFEARLSESSTLAFRVAYSVLRHREDAEDVAQEAFVKAFRSFGQLRDRERFRAWLVRMTWRLAIDRHRGNRRRVAREIIGHDRSGGEGERDVAADSNPADMVVMRERAEHLWRAIDALPEKLRVVVVLAGIEEHDIGKVALLLDIPAGTVKSRLFIARQRLKENLQCMAIDETPR